MKTRFDGKLWVGAFGVAFELSEMETAHLLNTVKMLVQKPAKVQAMLITDIENANLADNAVWSATKQEDTCKQSISNVTSLNSEELVEYVTETVLFKSMLEELETRGVNTENIMQLYTKDAAFQN